MTADALILAGSRGPDDPVAAHFRLSHKALAPIAGQVMLLRVIRALADSAVVGRIFVSIERPELLDALAELRPWREAGRLLVDRAAGSPSRSLAKALEEHPDVSRWLVTTADHPLLTPAMIAHFWNAVPSTADAAVALASEATIRAAYPDSRRTYLRFRDRAVSGCNLFALQGPRKGLVPAFWTRMERHRKKPWRMALEIGLGTTLAFLLRRLSEAEVFERLSARIGVRAVPIDLPFAEAAIDVDRPGDVELVEAILRRREAR